MFVPTTIIGHVALYCNHMISSLDENNNIKKVCNYDLMGDEFICHKVFFESHLYIDVYYYVSLFMYVNDDIQIKYV